MELAPVYKRHYYYYYYSCSLTSGLLLLISWLALITECYYDAKVVSVSDICSTTRLPSVISNNRLYFARIIYLGHGLLKTLLTVDCIMALEQIVYNTDHFIVTLYRLPTEDMSTAGDIIRAAGLLYSLKVQRLHLLYFIVSCLEAESRPPCPRQIITPILSLWIPDMFQSFV